jgi:CDP-paratose 2-epimerase
MTMLVTGSAGLIGSEAVLFFSNRGQVVGIDNNFRKVFFGEAGDTSWNVARLRTLTPRYVHYEIDIRDADAVDRVFQAHRFDAIIHCAAQPSHDKAADIPQLDFGVNANGTLNLLEATRRFCPGAVFVHVSTNKVYGDAPNEVPLVELERRWDYARPEDAGGITEECRVDRCLHSLFGASKLAGDILAQEYGRYFGLKTGVFRGGCLTGPQHSGVELHGFLSYLVKAAAAGTPYTIFGYKGKQVRDNLHALDVVRAFDAFIAAPRPGEVYNLGGGRENSISVIEAIDAIQQLGGGRCHARHSDTARIGDHICYISDMSKFRRHYPGWTIEHRLDAILTEMIDAERGAAGRGRLK